MATGGLIYVPYSTPAISNSDTLVSGATLTINIAGGGLASVFSDASGRFLAQSTLIWADDSQTYDCILNYNNGTSFTFAGVLPVGPPVNTSSFAPINSPAFTGTPTAPTPATNDNSQKIATTGFVKAQG